jgi:hypothetical protein
LSEDKDKIEIIKYLIENKKACFDKQYLLETPSTLTKSKPSSEDKKNHKEIVYWFATVNLTSNCKLQAS